ncbi:MAG: hypothetical protein AB1589_06660 [Cyanobacteriota bacterium]
MRISIYGSLVNIARENLALALSCQKMLEPLSEKLASLTGDDADYCRDVEIGSVKNKLSNYCLVTIVFAALAVEGYIYDYAARNLSDRFVDQHLDRLDVVSKWVVIPNLITGQDFPKEGNAFRLLKQLIKNRNYIVHNKSTQLLSTDEKISEEISLLAFSGAANKMVEFNDSILEKAEEAIITLDELAVVMESLDPNEYTSTFFNSPVGRAKQQWEQYGFWPFGH